MQAIRRVVLCAFLLCAPGAVLVAGSEAHYIANAGVMIVSGETKVVFDPLFREDFDQYDLAPGEVQRQLIEGAPPFDGIDAVFISHSHDDHFDPGLILEFLQQNESARLFGPGQAIAALWAKNPAEVESLQERIDVVAPEPGAPSTSLQIDGMQVTAVFVPHEGWPDYMSDVENIVFSVKLDADTSVAHLGDADPAPEHFQDGFWESRHHHLALPPYWFFLREKGRRVLDDIIAADHAVGVHVPTRMPDDPESRPAEFGGFDLFTRPGEIRSIGTPEK